MTQREKIFELIDKFISVSDQIKNKAADIRKLKEQREKIVNDLDSVLPDSLSVHLYNEEE